ncbi:MAG: dihydropyrimidinase [Peptococcaceae bacterium]|jgi:dihydropyrimidinase|nr:dihydropyrimidinase [Peptococcaceae bacterium]
MDKLIKNGTLVLPQRQKKADMLIRGEKIEVIGFDLDYDPAHTEVVDTEGCLVFPGFIDSHTHFSLDNGLFTSPDDFASGSKAAILGGTTTILDFATQNRGETLAEGLVNWHAMAKGKTSCDYGFHMAISEWNTEISREIEDMVAVGVTSFKVYMAYDALRLTDREIYEILERIGMYGGILGAHCENGDLIQNLTARLQRQGHTGAAFHPYARPTEVEAEAVNRFLTIAKLAGMPANIVHLSTAKGLALVENARAQGQEVYVETCPQYLLMDELCYQLPEPQNAVYILSPPLRSRADQEALWRAAEDGVIDTIGTDHCSFNLAGQKDRNLHDFTRIPNGIPGVGHRPVLMYTYGVADGRITPETMAKLLAENPAKLFGLYPRKGILAEGSDADVVVWDPIKTGIISAATQAHNVDNTPYEGWPVKGGIRQVYLRGELVADEKGMVKSGLGCYLSRCPSQFYR